MSFKFNPFTGDLDYFELGGLSNITFISFEKDADANDVINKTFTLGSNPISNSEIFFLNGLAQSSDCYTIVNDVLTLDPSYPIEIGDSIIIKFASV